MPKSPAELLRVARHEAGHYVCARIAIVPHGWRLCEPWASPVPYRGRLGNTPWTPEGIETRGINEIPAEYALALAGGGAGERMYYGSDDGSKDDAGFAEWHSLTDYWEDAQRRADEIALAREDEVDAVARRVFTAAVFGLLIDDPTL